MANPEDEIHTLKLALEESRQELYATKRSLASASAMKLELELEIERLNKETSKLSVNNEDKMRDAFMSKVSNLQSALDEERELNDRLNARIKELEKDVEEARAAAVPAAPEPPLPPTPVKPDAEDRLREELHASQVLLMNKTEELTQSKARLEDLTHQLTELQERLEDTVSSLRVTKESLEELQDEKACLSSELAALKAAPVKAGASRGNSLFAEVDDKRKSYEQKMNLLVQKYNMAKQKLNQKNVEINNLKMENCRLRSSWQIQDNSFKESVDSLLLAHKEHIQNLNQRIAELELRPVSPQIRIIGEESDLAWVTTMINQLREEKGALDSKLQSSYLENLQLANKLYLADERLRQAKIEYIQLEGEFDELKLKMAEEPRSSDSMMAESISASGKSSVMTRPDSESQPPSARSVTFAEDVKTTDGGTNMKGSRIRIKTEPAKIPHFHFPSDF